MEKNSDDKKHTNLLLRRDILQYARENKINLSGWVNSEFYAKFMSGAAIISRIQSLKQQLAEEESKLAGIKCRKEELSKSLTDREIRFITSVKAREAGGFKLEAMHKYFNEEFHRNISPGQFNELIQQYEAVAEGRIEHVAERYAKKLKKVKKKC